MSSPSFPTSCFRVVVAAVIALGACLPSNGHTQDRSDTETIRRAFVAWSDGTGGPYTLLADRATWTITGNSAVSKTYESREAFLSEVIRPFNARMKTGLKPTLRQIFQDGDTVIVFFDASGMARDGQPYRNTYAWFLTMQDGQIVRAVAFFDSISFDAFWKRVQPAS